MKRILSSILFVLPISVLAHDDHSSGSQLLAKSPVTASVVAALEMFEESSAGTPVAFHGRGNESASAVKLNYVDDTLIVHSVGYDCHSHSHDDQHEAHCHAEDLASPGTTVPAPQFSADQLLSSLELSSDIFARKVAPLQTLTQVKMWQSGDSIWATLTYVKESAENKSHFMCHVHGEHFDCHRTRSPGPQEPPVWE